MKLGKRPTKREYEKALKIVATKMAHDAIAIYKVDTQNDPDTVEDDDLQGIMEWYYDTLSHKGGEPNVIEDVYSTANEFEGSWLEGTLP